MSYKNFRCSGYGASVGKRETNQDSYLCDPDKGLFGVFDGVGGAFNSERASQLVVDAITKASADLGSLERDDRFVAPWLCEIVQSAHDRLLLTGAQTTASIAVFCINEEGAYLLTLNVGDSRVYGFKKSTQELNLLTTDDSAFRDPRLDDVEADTKMSSSMDMAFRFRNVITRAIGGDGLGPLETSLYPINDYDGFLLTSDGVHDNLSTREMLNILLDPAFTPQAIPDALIAASLARAKDLDHVRHKPDDITAVYVVPHFA